MNSSSHSICSLLLLASSWLGCMSDEAFNVEDRLHGTIAYPFVPEEPLGGDPRREPLVIRARSEGREYEIEIPEIGDAYSLEIPIHNLESQFNSNSVSQSIPGKTTKTDRELTAALPKATSELATSRQRLLDRAFEVEDETSKAKTPSYIAELAKIKALFAKRKYEFALVAIDNLLLFYRNSPKLHKMKGTVLLKMRHYKLAEASWQQALEYEPRNRSLKQALAKLRRQIEHN